jgi:hypothetical protein
VFQEWLTVEHYFLQRPENVESGSFGEVDAGKEKE